MQKFAFLKILTGLRPSSRRRHHRRVVRPQRRLRPLVDGRGRRALLAAALLQLLLLGLLVGGAEEELGQRVDERLGLRGSFERKSDALFGKSAYCATLILPVFRLQHFCRRL